MTPTSVKFPSDALYLRMLIVKSGGSPLCPRNTCSYTGFQKEVAKVDPTVPTNLGIEFRIPRIAVNAGRCLFGRRPFRTFPEPILKNSLL